MLAIGAPRFDALADDAGRMDVAEVFTKVHTPYWDCLGNPVLALPIGFTAAGMPLSMQLAGCAFDEATVLRVGDAFQSATDWHLRMLAMAERLAAA